MKSNVPNTAKRHNPNSEYKPWPTSIKFKDACPDARHIIELPYSCKISIIRAKTDLLTGLLQTCWTIKGHWASMVWSWAQEKLHTLLLQNMLHHKANANLHFKNSVVLSEGGLADYLLCLNRYQVPKLFAWKNGNERKAKSKARK